MDVTDEVNLITKGFKRYYNEVRQGFWTPELANWTDKDGFESVRDLRSTGDINPASIICVTQDKIGHEDLEVVVSGQRAFLSEDHEVTINGKTRKGYVEKSQHGQKIYEKKYGLYTTDYEIDFNDNTIEYKEVFDSYDIDDSELSILNISGVEYSIDSSGDIDSGLKHYIPDRYGTFYTIYYSSNPKKYGGIYFNFSTNSETGYQWSCYIGNSEESGPITIPLSLNESGDSIKLFALEDLSGGEITSDGIIGADVRIIDDDIVKNTPYSLRVDYDIVDQVYDVYLSTGVTESPELAAANVSMQTWDFNNEKYINEMLEVDRMNFYAQGIDETIDPSLTGYERTMYIDNIRDIGYGNEVDTTFTIPKHTNPGEVFQVFNKDVFKITDVDVDPRQQSQPLTDLKFYGLADNGSKILHSINWNKTFSDIKTAMFGMFGHPNKCPRCNGEGEVSGYQCIQCDGYGWDGPNASGEMLNILGSEVNLSRTDDLEVFRNKIWAKNWLIVPTRNEIRRYFSHFSRLDESEVELILDTGQSGMYSVLNIYLPLGGLDVAIFGTGDFWEKMADRCANAGTRVGFSLKTREFTGELTFEESDSPYHDFYSGGTHYSGYVDGEDFTGVDTQYGFYEPFSVQRQLDSFERRYSNLWGGQWKFANFTGQDSGDGIRTGYQLSGETVIHGNIGSGEWWRWAQIEDGLSDADNGIDWHTGESSFVDQQALWDSGTYYWDNFWVSGNDGIQY